jgi:hypothetical protein
MRCAYRDHESSEVGHDNVGQPGSKDAMYG